MLNKAQQMELSELLESVKEKDVDTSRCEKNAKAWELWELVKDNEQAYYTVIKMLAEMTGYKH